VNGVLRYVLAGFGAVFGAALLAWVAAALLRGERGHDYEPSAARIRATS
jgi:hypothetical protein